MMDRNDLDLFLDENVNKKKLEKIFFVNLVNKSRNFGQIPHWNVIQTISADNPKHNNAIQNIENICVEFKWMCIALHCAALSMLVVALL